MLERIFSCDCKCVQKNIYTVLASAHLALLVGSVIGSATPQLRNNELKNLVLYLLVFVLVFLILEWLCENNYSEVAWVIAVLPLLACVLHGHRMAQLGMYEPTNLPQMVLQRYRII